MMGLISARCRLSSVPRSDQQGFSFHGLSSMIVRSAKEVCLMVFSRVGTLIDHG